ncbi:uncharacterized protein LOC135093466 [Scylla paramamosain]|uniref:uncharacterized protein LOC135093466 n=1 Tax=Scylla paramamosain TaxID=85552 RepID=UPI003083BF43
MLLTLHQTPPPAPSRVAKSNQEVVRMYLDSQTLLGNACVSTPQHSTQTPPTAHVPSRVVRGSQEIVKRSPRQPALSVPGNHTTTPPHYHTPIRPQCPLIPMATTPCTTLPPCSAGPPSPHPSPRAAKPSPRRAKQ